MDIKCSGEIYLEPIPTEKCLECAINMGGTQPCGYGYRLLKNMFSTMEDRSDSIHVTDLLGCPLRAYYNKIDPAPQFVHDMLVLWIGIVIHNATEVDDEHVKSELPVGNDHVVGRLDAIYEDGHIEDTKTTRWMKPSQLPYGNHAEQINMYNALYDGDAKSLQIQMIDLSGPTRCRKDSVLYEKINGVVQCPICGSTNQNSHLGAEIVEVPVYDKKYALEELNEKAIALREAIDNREEPEPEPSYLCNYCPVSHCASNPSYVDF